MEPPPVERPTFERWPAAVYAIGDVHGCLRQLLELEEAIAADAASFEGELWIVMLGDYVDRGPDSARVIDHIRSAPSRFRRFSLRGNHEQMMLDFLRDPIENAFWLHQGAAETLGSYGIDSARSSSPPALARLALSRIPVAHLDFIRRLPTLLCLPGWVFVHAGIRPGLPLSEQTDDDLMWIRNDFIDSDGLPGFRVVHGHTPVPEPVVTAARVGIDTRCYHTGRLTAVRITPDGETAFLSAN